MSNDDLSRRRAAKQHNDILIGRIQGLPAQHSDDGEPDPRNPNVPKGTRPVSSYARLDADFYREPRWAVDALFDVEPFPMGVYDPACGSGTIPLAAEARGWKAVGTDAVARGYGLSPVDFLTVEPSPVRGDIPGAIVSNPPFKHAEAFIRRAFLYRAPKVAMLLRLSFLEGQRRKVFFESTPLARVWVFSRRVSMPPGDMEIEAKGGAVAFCWMVWETGYTGKPTLGWL